MEPPPHSLYVNNLELHTSKHDLRASFEKFNPTKVKLNYRFDAQSRKAIPTSSGVVGFGTMEDAVAAKDASTSLSLGPELTVRLVTGKESFDMWKKPSKKQKKPNKKQPQQQKPRSKDDPYFSPSSPPSPYSPFSHQRPQYHSSPPGSPPPPTSHYQHPHSPSSSSSSYHPYPPPSDPSQYSQSPYHDPHQQQPQQSQQPYHQYDSHQPHSHHPYQQQQQPHDQQPYPDQQHPFGKEDERGRQRSFDDIYVGENPLNQQGVRGRTALFFSIQTTARPTSSSMYPHPLIFPVEIAVAVWKMDNLKTKPAFEHWILDVSEFIPPSLKMESKIYNKKAHGLLYGVPKATKNIASVYNHICSMVQVNDSHFLFGKQPSAINVCLEWMAMMSKSRKLPKVRPVEDMLDMILTEKGMNANLKEAKLCSAFSSIGYRTLSENRCDTHQEFSFDGKCAVSELFAVLGVLKRALEG